MSVYITLNTHHKYMQCKTREFPYLILSNRQPQLCASRMIKDLVYIQTTITSISPTLCTPPDNLSPGSIGPTPAGVPVKIKSPPANSNDADRVAMISGTDQINWLRSPSWRNSPFTVSQIRPLMSGVRTTLPAQFH